MSNVAAARRAAWDVLCAYLVAEPKKARLGTGGRPFPPAGLAPRDRALARSLAEGVVRRLATLDLLARALGKGKPPRPVGLRVAFLLGAYQLLFEHRVPARAAVHESVALARRAAGEGGARFVNALLRKLAARRDLARWVPPPGPTSDSEAWARFHSCPPALVARWRVAFGDADLARILHASNVEPWLGLRTNRLRIEPAALAQRLAEEGIRTRPGRHPLTLLLDRGDGGASLLGTAAFREGLFAIQDCTQTEIVDLLDLAPQMRMLDYCAAPGGKSTASAEAMQDRGAVLAFDQRPERLRPLPGECERLGLASVEVLFDRASLERAAAQAPIDRVLVDAPCSNTGVLGRRPEARWRFDARELTALVERQAAIVREAHAFLRPGGRLVYATCSIEPEENEELAQRLASELDLRLLSTERILPEAGVQDGGGVSVFLKRKER